MFLYIVVRNKTKSLIIFKSRGHTGVIISLRGRTTYEHFKHENMHFHAMHIYILWDVRVMYEHHTGKIPIFRNNITLLLKKSIYVVTELHQFGLDLRPICLLSHGFYEEMLRVKL